MGLSIEATQQGPPFLKDHRNRGSVMNKRHVLSLLIFGAATASAAPVTFTLDPDHTHPTIEVDHFGGISTWRAIFKTTSGKVQFDAATKTGSVDVLIDTASIDFAHDKMNEKAVSSEILDVAQFPMAQFKGKFADFANDAPKTVVGELTLHGVTKPVTLKINSFKCFDNPLIKKYVCGADAVGNFNRADFGVNIGEQYGFKQDVLLRIQVEGIRQD
jgi:polyisoprenoid-binding protein YceI